MREAIGETSVQINSLLISPVSVLLLLVFPVSSEQFVYLQFIICNLYNAKWYNEGQTLRNAILGY